MWIITEGSRLRVNGSWTEEDELAYWDEEIDN